VKPPRLLQNRRPSVMPITAIFRQPNRSPNSPNSRSSRCKLAETQTLAPPNDPNPIFGRYATDPRSMRPITSFFSRIFNSLRNSQSLRTDLGWNPDSQDFQTTLIPFSDTSPHPSGAGPWPADLPTPSWRAFPARPPHLHESRSVPPQKNGRVE
jgi:hypothetical protein